MTNAQYLSPFSPQARAALCALLARRPELYGIGVTPALVCGVKENA